MKVSHVEDVGAWVGAIREYLEGAKGAVSFVELVKGLEMWPNLAVILQRVEAQDLISATLRAGNKSTPLIRSLVVFSDPTSTKNRRR